MLERCDSTGGLGPKGIEVTPFVGGQINGGLDLSTSLYNRLEVKNVLNYGVIASYSIGNYSSVEFMWNHNQADTQAQPVTGGANIRVFALKTNQYLGDFLVHFKDSESRLRPFVLFGAGATNLAPDRSQVNSTTRFAWEFGGGVKYTLSKHLGVRLQAKWSPTYINTTTQGVWCDPFWAGCWTKGDSVFLNDFDFTGGLAFPFQTLVRNPELGTKVIRVFFFWRDNHLSEGICVPSLGDPPPASNPSGNGYFARAARSEEGRVVAIRQLYWSFITATTVGYGDVRPTRSASRVLPSQSR